MILMVKLALAMSLHLHHSMCDGIDQSMLGEFDTHHDNEKNFVCEMAGISMSI